MDIIFYVGALQGLVLSVFLFSVKSNIIANRLLGLLTFFWGIILLIFALQSKGLFNEYPHLLKTFSHLEFAFFPLLYLHVKYLLSRHTEFNRKDMVHFIPMLFNILLYSGFYFQSAADKISISRAGEVYYYIASVISDEILTVQGIVYPIFILMMISRYNANILDYQSNIERRDLKALRVAIILSLVSWIFGIIAFHLTLFNIDIGFDLFIICYLFIVFIIYIISYIAIRSPEVFKLNEKQVVIFPQINKALETKRPAIAIIEDTVDNNFDAMNERLLEYMKNKKPYLNPELSLQDLANDLNLTRHQLSALINKKQHINFYSFINLYRVNEVKNLLVNPDMKDYKLITLAFEAGFNSKASFNRLFKQITNQTPSEYRESILAGSEFR